MKRRRTKKLVESGKILRVNEAAQYLGRSSQWVTDNSEALHGVKLGKDCVFFERVLKNFKLSNK
jgi:hypothetical protein